MLLFTERKRVRLFQSRTPLTPSTHPPTHVLRVCCISFVLEKNSIISKLSSSVIWGSVIAGWKITGNREILACETEQSQRCFVKELSFHNATGHLSRLCANTFLSVCLYSFSQHPPGPSGYNREHSAANNSYIIGGGMLELCRGLLDRLTVTHKHAQSGAPSL